MGLPWFLSKHDKEHIIEVLTTFDIGDEVEIHGQHAVIAETLIRNKYAACDRMAQTFAGGRVDRVRVTNPRLEDLGRALLAQLRDSEP